MAARNLVSVELLIFDLDGTLVDSCADIATAVNRAFLKMGLPLVPVEEVTKYIGIGATHLIAKVARERGENDVEKVIEQFHLAFHECFADETTVYPGMLEALKALPQPKVVLTNKSARFTEKTLDAFGLKPFFESWYSRESFGVLKPSPVGCIEIAKRYHLPPDRVLILGDTSLDILSGKRAGIRTGGVLFGYGSEKELSALAPDFLIKKPLELLGVLTHD